MNLNIPIVIGTNREGNRSQFAAKFIKEVIEKEYPDIETKLVSPKDFLEGDIEQYKNMNEQADGFIYVVPEYNHSFPGALKLLLDSDLANYNHKPAAVAGVSSGPWGGTRGVQSLIPVLRELGLVMTATDAYFTNSYDKLADDGSFKGDVEQQIKGVKNMLDELVWMAKTLKAGRNE